MPRAVVHQSGFEALRTTAADPGAIGAPRSNRSPSAACRQAITLNPNDAIAYNNRGLAKRDKGDAAGADADIAKAKQLNPSIGN
jgi:Flp pilus assembly protein TadD